MLQISYSSKSAYKIILAAHNITNSAIGTGAVRRSVSKIIRHEAFDDNQAYDIALIQLDVFIRAFN